MRQSTLQARRSMRIAKRSAQQPENEVGSQDVENQTLNKRARLSGDNNVCLSENTAEADTIENSPASLSETTHRVPSIPSAGSSGEAQTVSQDINVSSRLELNVENYQDLPRTHSNEGHHVRLSDRGRLRGELLEEEQRDESSLDTLPDHRNSPSNENRSPLQAQIPITEFNRCKMKVAELTRDKITLSHAAEAMVEKCKRMENMVIQQKQQIIAFESMLSHAKVKGRKSTKNGSWTVTDERSSISCYKGLKFQLDLIANQQAALVVTETYLSEDGLRRARDWTKTATMINHNCAEEYQIYVRLPSGSFAVPTCAMVRASHPKFYINRYSSTSEFVREVTRNLLNGSSGTGMGNDEKETCITKISCYPSVLSKFRAALREECNTCKQGAKSSYLKSLGYQCAHLGESRKELENDMRSKEKELVYSRCVNTLSDGVSDTMHWRLATLSELRNRAGYDSKMIERMRKAEEKVATGKIIDHIFMNEPARIAFNQIRGYNIDENSKEEQDVSILSLARADAWMTTALQNIKVTGKGGSRSNELVEKYESLVQSSLETIINDIWDDSASLVPLELKLNFQQINSSSDPYCNKNREWTAVIESPDDGYVYLLATPKYFCEKVCSWFGKVKDVQIGRAKKGCVDFKRITKSMTFESLEDSDIDEME